MNEDKSRLLWTDLWKPGQWWGTPQVDGAYQTGPGLFTHGWKEHIKVLNKNDKILILTIIDDNERPRQFTVTKDVKSDGDGCAFIPLSPYIMEQCLPNGALITVLGR